VISFLKEHGREIYTEVRAAYVDTMNKVNLQFPLCNTIFNDLELLCFEKLDFFDKNNIYFLILCLFVSNIGLKVTQ
jgi:Vps52 / Sac2 family